MPERNGESEPVDLENTAAIQADIDRTRTELGDTAAALGAKLDVPTVDGSRLTVKLPAGASSGSKRLRLKGKGIKGGDQYIDIKVLVPAATDARSRELLEELGRLHPQTPRSGPPWE